MFNYQRLPWDEHPPDAKWASSQLLKTSIFACRHKWRQCFPIDFLSNHQQPKKRGVENPEWDISICAIVGLPLKKISFVIVYLSKCVSWLFWGIQYTIIRMVYPIFGQTCLPNCCIINSVPSIPHIITAHTHMFAVRIPPYQQTNGSHTRINGSLYLQTYKHTHISYTV